jgi:hypothetical protein
MTKLQEKIIIAEPEANVPRKDRVGGTHLEVSVRWSFALRRSIPSNAAEAVELAKLLLQTRGYIVLSTMRTGRALRIHERTTVLWTIQQDQPFSILGETDQEDWDEQLDVIRAAYPQWQKKECDESGSRFWRAVTD